MNSTKREMTMKNARDAYVRYLIRKMNCIVEIAKGRI